MAKIKFSLKLTDRGWAEAVVATEETEVKLTTSYIFDGLSSLTSAVIGLLQLADKAECSWAEEPGEYRWLFEKQADLLNISILWFDDYIGSKYISTEKGKSVFSAKVPLLDFAIQVRGQLRQLVNDLGVEGYKQQWGHEFPASQLKKLEELIRERKREEAF